MELHAADQGLVSCVVLVSHFVSEGIWPKVLMFSTLLLSMSELIDVGVSDIKRRK